MRSRRRSRPNEAPLGTLKFRDGASSAAKVQKLYDNLHILHAQAGGPSSALQGRRGTKCGIAARLGGRGLHGKPWSQIEV